MGIAFRELQQPQQLQQRVQSLLELCRVTAVVDKVNTATASEEYLCSINEGQMQESLSQS